MNVLLLSLFHPEVVRGGAQQVCLDLFEGLKAAEGITPTLLAAVDPSRLELYKSGARITGFDGRPGEHLFLSRGYDHFWNRLDGDDLAEAYVAFLDQTRPDVVHFHAFLLFGLDFLTLTRRVLPRARIVFTLHEFLAICEAHGQRVRPFDGSICHRASPYRCHQCFPAIPPETFFTRAMWTKRHLEAVDVFTTPSRFMIDVYADWGLERTRLAHVANGTRAPARRIPAPRPGGKRNRFGFFGQMIDNKGLQVILRAVGLLRAEGFTDLVVELNSADPGVASAALRREIEDFLAAEAALPADQRMVWDKGAYEVSALAGRMGRIDWCLVPSLWPEAFGLVVSEAWSHGRPVIGSEVGALAERVRDGVDGLLFPVGDERALAEAMRRACTEEGLWERLAAGIIAPEGCESMVARFVALYEASG